MRPVSTFSILFCFVFCCKARSKKIKALLSPVTTTVYLYPGLRSSLPPGRFPFVERRSTLIFFESFFEFNLRKIFVSLLGKMHLWCGILAVFTILILWNQSLAADKKDTKKLQIGVKKRVANCQTRSKSGDKLHMHYTVSDTLWR